MLYVGYTNATQTYHFRPLLMNCERQTIALLYGEVDVSGQGVLEVGYGRSL